MLAILLALPVWGQTAAIRVRHSKMMQVASPATVQGDFSAGRIELRGAPFVVAHNGGAYTITESELSGKPWEHKVEYILGGRRIQEYLTTLPDGSIVVLAPVWDSVGKKWIHAADDGNPEEGAERLWNKDCYSCHLTGGRKGFDAGNLRYRTTWSALGVTCESCHGPRERNATVACDQCHSLRDVYVDDFQAGNNYYDHFLPVMEYRLPQSADPAFWADGRPRWPGNESVALGQSQCYLKGGISCAACHAQHRTSEVNCTGCHRNVAAHSHHEAKTATCVDCHMPATVTGFHAKMRDHTIGIPVPENTVAHGIPNACNACHRDKDAAWAVQRMTAWYGTRTRQKWIARAAAFTQARKADAAAAPALLQTLADVSGGPWIRANAAGYLGSFPDDRAAYDALRAAFADDAPLVRATAAAAIRARGAQREALAPELVTLLRDPVATVRMNAGIALVAMGVKPFPGEDGARFESAKALYRARASLNADDAGQQFAAGRFFYLAGDLDSAAAAFRTVLKLDPAVPAQYPLARSLADKGDLAGARQILEAIPRTDQQYAPAQQLLAEIEAKGAQGAQALFLEGQVQYRSEYYGAALKDFEQALQQAPQAEWAQQAQIYRAICLEKLARTAEAESAMRALSETPAARRDVELQLAFVELLSETGRAEDALKRVDELIAVVPTAPLAYFWRARLLLDSRRTDEAAKAAEQSIALQAELPQAHNLLIRIYQMQGRTKEAAEQAQWVRDYERRIK